MFNIIVLVVLAVLWVLAVTRIAEDNYWSPAVTWLVVLGGALLIGLLL